MNTIGKTSYKTCSQPDGRWYYRK